jgi:hypothetical protein
MLKLKTFMVIVPLWIGVNHQIYDENTEDDVEWGDFDAKSWFVITLSLQEMFMLY